MITRENTLDDFIIKEVKQYLTKFNLKKTDNLLDLGANIGAFSVIASPLVESVYSFEPEEDNFKILAENCKELSNIYYFKKAVVGNDDKKRDFYVNQKANKGIHGFLAKRGRLTQEVECENINYIIQKFHINKIKMDIEGSEYELIPVIDFKNIDEIILEFHFIYLKDKDKSKYNKIIEILKNNFSKVVYKEDTKKAWTTIIYCSKM